MAQNISKESPDRLYQAVQSYRSIIEGTYQCSFLNCYRDTGYTMAFPTVHDLKVTTRLCVKDCHGSMIITAGKHVTA